jgi:hypothetical protein
MSEGNNSMITGAAGAEKAAGFADKVRLGAHGERVRKHALELGALRARLVDVLSDLDAAIREGNAIGEAIARDRDGR